MTQMATDIYKYNFKGMDIHNSQLVWYSQGGIGF